MDATKASESAAIADVRSEQLAAMEKDCERSSDDGNISSSPDDEERDKEVVDLARKFTRESSISAELNPFEAEKDSVLDPFSPNFKPRAFTKSILHLQSRDPEKWPKRTAGFCFSNLNVYGFGSATDFQSTVGSIFLKTVGFARKFFGVGQRRIDILRNLDGLVREGELLVVLGPPGSGCSTFLKTIAGETHGFFLDKGSHINYQGIESEQMHKDFRGEAIYTAEVDVHFPQLTVGQTLEFAAAARTPRHIPGGVSSKRYARLMRDVTMATLGISHTVDTRVGNEYIRGVSGGEKKRVTIAEAALCGAPLQCWDNSTRGLDSANAIEFCKTIRMGTELVGATACVAIYQASQSAYDIFDKALVLYQGRQIFFGPTNEAKDYFVRLGFECEDRQTTADFLTSMTSPAERLVRTGFEDKVPRSLDDFAEAWMKSPERERLMVEIAEYNESHKPHGEHLEKFKASRRAQQAKIQRVSSPYTLSYHGQVLLCLRRGFWRLRGDPSITFTQLFGNSVMALIIGSIFYNLPGTTESFYSRGALLFFAGLLNAFGSALEILTLYAQRPIVEKHSRYAFYHPSCEAFASMLTDMPYKIGNAIFFNLALYFLTDLRRTVPAFFIFFLISFTLTLTMSMLFRTIASMSRSLSEAMTPAAIMILGIIIYTGFALPIPYMRGWARWINYVNPVAYAFESLMINEFWGRSFECSAFVPEGPGYNNATGTQRVCSTVGSQPGLSVVSGSDYISTAYQYEYSHLWRNYGILLVFMAGLCATYLLATEFITAKKSKGEVLLFRRGHAPTPITKKHPDDIEASVTRVRSSSLPNLNQVHSAHLEKTTAIFHWRDVCFNIPVKGGNKSILDNVDGWIKPGTLTALMGVSGAGKTTLLDCLADRATIGVITGDIMVDGRQRDDSFTRSTGYVQQLDLHLSTTTVREALNFSALLRQPAHVSKEEKLAYVGEVIKMLEMEEWVDAIVGVPGEGLNVEQRKRLTIGVELAAKPQLLLFFDEPTSGLDSQTSWAICDLMEKLVQSGQAVLCTIHQPSAILFQRFDRLLFLAAGGKTVYFGEIGENSSTLTQYFERNGAPPCPPNANPAEWMLEIIGAAPGSHTDIDWQQTWRTSPEYASVHRELDQLAEELPQVTQPVSDPNDKTTQREFAADFKVQLVEVTKRVFEQYWRTPSYIYSKVSLCILAGLFIGFSFYDMPNSQQGLINQMFAIFLLFTIFGQLVQQIMPHFVTQRALYEARERPSKTYSWKAFMLANILVELPYNAAMGVVLFFTVYYPIGLYKNAEATNAVNERGALFFLLLLQFMLFTSTFTNMVIAAIESAEEGGNIANLMFSLTLIFNGVLAPPGKFPEFWIFMYRLSPFTYLVSAMLSTGLANTEVVCSPTELLHFQSPPNMTCGEYMETYRSSYGGYLEDSSASDCSFCPLSSTNQFLVSISSSYDTRWRNFGILFVYIFFNVFAAVFLYWLVRVPKKKSRKVKTE